MTPTLERILRGLERDRALPLPSRLVKGGRFVAASALAQLYLRDCTRVGARPRTLGRPRIGNQGVITAGDDLILNSTFVPSELEAGPAGRVELGHDVAINFGTLIAAQARVTLGDRVSVGPYCVIADHDHAGAGAEAPRPIEIADDVWLASRVTVLPGARIGKGSVITAGSVVSGTISPGVVAGGNPARTVRALDRGRLTIVEPAPVEAPTALAEPKVLTPRVREVLRGVVLADFTVGDLEAMLRDPAEGPVLEVVASPYCQVVPTLLAGPPGEAHDFVVIWTRPELVSSAFQRLCNYEVVSEADLNAEVDAFVARVREGAKAYRFTFVPTWTLPPWHRGLGSLEASPSRGGAWGLALMNARLMAGLAGAPAITVLDAQRWLARTGLAGAGPRGWYLGKVLYQGEVLAEAARDLKAAVRGQLGQARKLVVVDLDDTLWGGIVGDVGWEHLTLGGHDAEGEALVDFQKGLKALTRRGIVLAIVSKNDEAVALEAIAKHPEMALQQTDFVGWRINWKDKAQNLVDLAAELNLGLQSVVFLDDNPAERARVREMLPEVLVPDWPTDKLLYPAALQALHCFDAPLLSAEDAQRTEMYRREHQREESKQQVGNLEEWLEGLEIRVRAEPLSSVNLARVAQLLNKTNQMNLSTRRLTEAELQAWAASPDRVVWAFYVTDRFGEAGLTGIVGIERIGEVARVVDFVLSCRVFGRNIEQAMAHVAITWARAQAVPRVEAHYRETSKNKPTLDFLRTSQFSELEAGLFCWDTTKAYPLPHFIQLTGQGLL
jgi:FkbH-like protein